ncbi:OmpA family protein [Flavobacterium sp. J49]|uniref:OmpA family protein n=1 Tax=Flavobacterium sp. J49 TaxID=2718534 RepID=UPI0015944C40|nr:OmpA family protein [Flavobacterium sp. J49]MBF6640132.1 OmpA family protein [Flavobacterium sp. J49]NIC01377.1 OmpA family protein [Flavobacterium sp. J49]
MKFKIAILFFWFSLNCWGQKQFEVFFDFNKDFPNQSSILSLNEWIANNKAIEITRLLGFCDSIDTKDYNKNLALRRIESVRELLDKSGLKFNKNLDKIAYGKEFKQSKIQAENRRVTIFYTEIVKEPIESAFSKQIRNSKVGETIKLPNIYFFNNSARIVPKSESSLYDLLCAMQENPKLKIEIQGHICCQMVNDFNNISTARARAIYNYLLRNKIDRKRMSFKGYGVLKPIHKIPEQNQTEEDENRRVEILILEN